MHSIITLTGKVKHPITIDPSVWIFDERKADLETFFTVNDETCHNDEAYTKAISKHWDREIMQGNEAPAQPEKKTFKKQEIANGTFGIRFAPFLLNAELEESASEVQILSKNGTAVLSLREAEELVALFSKNGKPLKDDGPLHFYFGDGSNKDRPIKGVTKIIVA
ncbi:peptidyl-prolyl cis-trans isomerase [Metabacillus sp. 84]|uniref:peptidyl-prolyl cis-trans isomerase n=1 Tax=unclassified Metabacillus TaxID=2675274 RepID=UPI003CEDADFF